MPEWFKISPGHLNWTFQGCMTCLSGIIALTFFCFLAVGGESTVSANLYPNASNGQLKVRGYYTQFPGKKSLKACSTKYAPTENSYEIFISHFRFHVPVKYKEDVEIHEIPMHKYLLDEAAVEVNNVTVFTKGVFDVSRVLGGPIYASLPAFLYGEESLHKDLGLDKPTADKHESLVSLCKVSRSFYQLIGNRSIELIVWVGNVLIRSAVYGRDSSYLWIVQSSYIVAPFPSVLPTWS